MIYFLDNSLQLQKIVTSKNVISAIHEHELNGLIRGDIELDLSYANKFLILGIDHVGYYYKDEFYLHKIQRVEYDHVNETATVVLRHIFFEDMIFGKLIQDVRPQNQDAVTVSRQTIDANTRWQTIMTDVTGRLSTNFYWQVPYEVIEFMTENYRIEYLPKILFDGQNINGFQLHLANKIGEDKNIRIPYGSRVLDLKYEEDYSEIITKLVVHGKGEEVGDGYGRRINISDVNFSRNGVESPVGSLYLEDESITNTYGNDGQTPREGREVFEDIENANELAEAGYQHYLQVSRPQMLFTADIADIGDVGIGDSVMIIRREYDVYFNARIHKLSVDLLYPEDAQVELGDYKHFKESKIARKTREKNNRVQGQLSDRITRLKREADERFDNEVGQWISEYEQALIDVHAEIEADRENMTNLIEGTRTEFTDNLNAEITQTKEYAEQQAQEKAEAVRTDLETVTSGHQQMLDNLESNVINIDGFLGSVRDITLDDRLQQINTNFIDYINNIPLNTRNILRGTSFDEPEHLTFYNDSYIRQGGDPLTIRMGPSTGSNTTSFRFNDSIRLEADTDYFLVLEHRSLAVSELDYLQLQLEDGSYQTIFDADTGLEGLNNLEYGTLDWHKKTIRINSSITLEGRLRIGTRFNQGSTTRGWIDVRQIYLTNTSNREWLPHPRDANQSIEEVTRRLTELEDGRRELITRTEYDLETGQINQTVRDIEETVDTSRNLIQEIQDLEIIQRGSEAIQTIEGFENKVWLNDVANIGANLVPQSSNAWEQGGLYIGSGTESDTTTNMRMKENIPVEPSVEYTIHDNSIYTSAIRFIDVHQYDENGGWIRNRRIERGGSHTFTTQSNTATVRIGFASLDGFHVFPRYIDNPDKRIQLKLEKGDTATPIINALSRIEQIADKVNMTVVELDGTYLKQSDFQLTPNYWQLGSMRIGADNVSSVLRGSPDALDAVVSNFNLTGNLNAKGQITSLAVDAIEGNFARLFSSELTANVITSDHIQVGTALVDKMFATRARIDELITKTHFVNEMHALTLDVVDLNASQIRTRILSANTIEAEWLKGGTALVDRIFSSNAMFERMMAKSGFVTTLNTVTIDTDQITIRRPDGYQIVNNGVPNWDFSYADTQPRFFSSGSSITGTYYKTSNDVYTTVDATYFQHNTRYVNIRGYAYMYRSTTNPVYGGNVRISTFGESNNVSDFAYIPREENSQGSPMFINLTLDLGKPDGSLRQIYTQTKVSNSDGYDEIRFRRLLLRFHG